MKKTNGVTLFLFIVALAIFAGPASAKQLFDDFSEAYINDNRWPQSSSSPPNEIVREVVSGRLVSKLGNNPSMLVAANTTRFQNAETINSIQCDVIINETVLDTGDGPMSFASVGAIFYNSRSSGGGTGDVMAHIFIGDRGNGLEAWWWLGEFTADDYDDYEEKGTGSIPVSGLQYGVAYTVKLEYDGASGFVFTVAEQAASFNSGPERQRDAVGKWKALRTGAYGYTGATGAGYVSAAFDNVYINGETTAYDTFDTALDATSWIDLETVKEVDNGSLRLNQQGLNSRSEATEYLSEVNASCIEVKMRIESGSIVSSGAQGCCRMGGNFYNDSKGSGSGVDYNGKEGDVFCLVELALNDDGSLQSIAQIWRTTDAGGNSYTNLFNQTFNMPIAFDTDYTLSIEYGNGQLVFKCNDETAGYTIPTPEYEPYLPLRLLTSRLSLDTGESGYLKSRIDDVYVADNPITAKQFIEGIYVAYWGRAADPEGLTYWEGMYNAGTLGFAGIAENFAISEEGKAAYSYFDTVFNHPENPITDEMRQDFVTAIYQNLFDRAPDAEGLAYWVGILKSGTLTPGVFIANIINSAYEGRQGASADDWDNIDAKIQVAEYYTDQIDAAGISWAGDTLDQAKEVLVGIDKDSDIDAAKGAIDAIIVFPTAEIPDTGQTTSYTDTVGEDADYTINPPAYTKLDASGNTLDDGATEWAMIRDNVTGLIWENKTEDDSIHDKDNTYTWYDPNADTNGGNPGTGGDGTDTKDFIDALNAAKFGGFSDWRLPTAKELQSIVNYGKTDPAIDTTYFSNTPSIVYWSSTTEAASPDGARPIDFHDGYIFDEYKSESFCARAVRGAHPGGVFGDSAVSGRMIDNGDGTITDKVTGLMWQKQDDGIIRSWESALTHCETLSIADYDDWRMPNIKELTSIVDFCERYPSVDTTFFPNTAASPYWSASSRAGSPEGAWIIDFSDGDGDADSKSSMYNVRGVRGITIMGD
ncbi:MAG: DUF1566 domain-containing protein [Pseudomonadota bacterium]